MRIDDWIGFVSSRPVHIPRTQPPAEWEARRHTNEAAYWAERLDDFLLRLPGMRRTRGDARAARLVRDVIKAVGAARGEDEAGFARERIAERWRGREGS